MGFISNILGKIMNAIFEMFYSLGLSSSAEIGLNIILSTIIFTIIVYTILLPMTIKQQKFSRISAVMNPEIQAIQSKYKGKNDQASMMKMQEETKLVYEKYGTSPTGGCLGSLIQLPILFALWPVIREISKYVDKVDKNKIYSFWGMVISGTEKTPASTPSTLFKSGEILLIVIAFAIPLLAGLSQWLSAKIAQNAMKPKNNNKKQDENDMAQQMNGMLKWMPVLSVIMCFSMPVVLGIYWIASAVVRIVQQIVINKVLDRKPIEALIEENAKKAEKKRAKKKQVESKALENMAQTKTRKIQDRKSTSENTIDSYRPNAKPGSLAAKANMVSDYNNRNNK